MFTGIVQKTGRLASLTRRGTGYVLMVEADHSWDDLKIGESIAVNGVCLTLTQWSSNTLSFDVSPETVNRSTLAHLPVGSVLNLERALRPLDRMGGHFVLGHVDGVGEVAFVKKETDFYRFGFRIPDNLLKYIAVKGSIAVDGISLTVAKKEFSLVEVAVIPHTFEVTNLRTLRPGDKVNVEVDVIARYLEALLKKEQRLIDMLEGMDGKVVE